MSPSRETLVRLYREMLRLRRVELRIESLYHLDQMKTPIHLCIGQEAIAAGVSGHLRADDTVSSNHRSHGHYLAKGGDLGEMIAELHCKKNGCTEGFGGSMHLVDTRVGHHGSSAIVGGGIALGTGMAFAFQMQRRPLVSVAYFGDGAADEGVLYECVNFAMLRRLPVVYVYENNQYSVCSRVDARQRHPLLFHRADRELLATATVDGNDVEAVYAAAGEAVERARSGGGPSLLECATYRVREHAGSGTDTTGKYRDPGEIAAWTARDPVERFRFRLLSDGIVRADQFTAMEAEIDAEIDAAFRFAEEGPLPGAEDLDRHLFAGAR